MSNSTYHLPIDNVHIAPPSADTSNQETIQHQQADLICTSDSTQTKTHREVIGVETAEGKVYSTATGLYNSLHKSPELQNLWHLFQSPHDLQHVESFSQQTKTGIDQHLWCGLDNFTIELLQLAHTLENLLSGVDFGLDDNSCNEVNFNIIWSLYYRHISYI